MTYKAKMNSDQREARRMEVVAMRRKGEKPARIAAKLGVAVNSVYAWSKKARVEGVRSLKTKPRGGRPNKLSAEERRELRGLIIAGPRKAGYDRELWTLPMVRELIAENFGVEYHVDHLSRVMALLNLTFRVVRAGLAARGARRNYFHLGRLERSQRPRGPGAAEGRSARKCSVASRVRARAQSGRRGLVPQQASRAEGVCGRGYR